MTDLEERLRQGPESVEALLKGARRPLSLSDPPGWHGLADGAGFNASVAFEKGDCSGGLTWARCAVSIYDCLAADVTEWNSFDFSSMNVRTNAICSCGVVVGSLVQDSSVVVAWVRTVLMSSPGEAVVRSAAFRSALANGSDPSLPEARALRAIKNRLSVLVRLERTMDLDADLRAWLEVRPQLI